MLDELVDVVIGVDTHKNTHTAAVVAASTGAALEVVTATADTGGYDTILDLADAHSDPTSRAWSIEGTGSYGAGLCAFLQARGELVYELDRPSRPARRDGAKDDGLDAVRAGRELLARNHAATPRAGSQREAMRILVATRDGASRDRTRAINQLKAAIVTAPEPLRDRLRHLTGNALIERCTRLRHTSNEDPAEHADVDAIRRLAARIAHLDREIAAHTADLEQLTTEHCPQLLDEQGIGPVTAAQIYTAWSHPGRCRNEAAFASLAGTAPIPASSGQTTRYRLNRGGDRQLNRALHTIVLTRTRCDPDTKTYIDRRLAEGKTRREARRCLKRYLARHLYRILETPPSPQTLTT
jgi:transposase